MQFSLVPILRLEKELAPLAYGHAGWLCEDWLIDILTVGTRHTRQATEPQDRQHRHAWPSGFGLGMINAMLELAEATLLRQIEKTCAF